jgi:hypothetical protein
MRYDVDSGSTSASAESMRGWERTQKSKTEEERHTDRLVGKRCDRNNDDDDCNAVLDEDACLIHSSPYGS